MRTTEIVIPCFNEADRLRPDRFVEYVHAQDRVRLVFVDDGSSDETASVLEGIRRRAPEAVDWFSLEANAGKGEAVRQGLLRAADREGTRYAGFWDADLSTPLELIGGFADVLDRRPDVTVVLGSRMKLGGRLIDREWYRCLLSGLFARSASVALGCRFQDTQCGAKLLRVDGRLRTLLATPFRSRWIFDVEFLQRLSWSLENSVEGGLADVVFEQPLDEWTEVGGSRLRVKDFVRAIREMAVIAGHGVWHRLGGLRRPGAAPVTSTGTAPASTTEPVRDSDPEERAA